MTALALRFGPYVAIVLLALAVWAQWERSSRLAGERDAATTAAVENAATIERMKVRQAETDTLMAVRETAQARSQQKLEGALRQLRSLQDETCLRLHDRVPDHWLLKPAG